MFEIDANGTETVLHNFSGEPDGELPEAALIRDSLGNLYGTTAAGGASGNGIVFKLDTGARRRCSTALLAEPTAGDLTGAWSATRPETSTARLCWAA